MGEKKHLSSASLAKLKTWLNGNRNYAIGLALANECIDNKSLLFMLGLGENSFNQKKLTDALSECYEQYNVENYKPVAAIVAENKKIQLNKYDKVDERNLPVPLKQRFHKIQQLYAYIKAERSTLPFLSDEDRRLSIFKMLDAQDEVAEHYKHIDYYETTGSLLDDVGVQEDEKNLHEKYISMLVAMKSYPQYVRKNKNNPLVADEVAKRQEMLNYINKVIENGKLI